ncbi:MAG TPA: thiol reductant ABC exporter subunit CydC [Mycobacteriales bacterium]|jgi:thiol reductant ABC exporter CydC subunit|nr:thiol reductant ABC exporter subunit CydC [Mycobacteriales bacterium]
MKLLSKRAMAVAVLSGAASEGAAIGLLATATWLIVRAAGHPPLSALAVGIAGVRAFAMIRGVLRYAERLAGHDAALRSLADLRVRVYAALAALRPAELRRRHSGELLGTVVAEVDAVTDLVVRCLIPAGSAALVAAGGIAGIALASPAAAGLVAVGLLVTGIALPAAAAWQSRRAERGTDTARADLTTATVDLLDGAADLAVAGATPAALAAAERASDRLAGRQRAVPAYGATAAVLLGSGLTALAVLGRTHSAVLTLATLALFEICAPLPTAARHWSQVSATLRRIAGLLRTEAPAAPTRTATGPVEVAGLRVDYDEAPALRGIDLRLEPGRRLALVGASGSGKSTLLATLAGLVEPSHGTVTIGGVPAGGVSGTVGGVLADAHVFHTSIADNVRLARPEASDAEVAAALSRAALTDWVATLPEGAATLVGEDAGLLSGGQRQRLLLARALLADRPILLLDEPSEGLDPATADALLDDLLTVTAGRTTVLVTHRLTGLEPVEEVLLLDAGRIVARGRHADLLSRPGPYRDLWLAEPAGALAGA